MKKNTLQLVLTLGFTIIGVVVIGQGRSDLGYWFIGVSGGINLPGLLGLDQEET